MRPVSPNKMAFDTDAEKSKRLSFTNSDSGFDSQPGIRDEQSSRILLEWSQKDSIPSKAYDEWIEQFGEAECPRCPEVFKSKLAWINHYINAHQNDLKNNDFIKNDTFKSITSLRNHGIDKEVARFVRNNDDFDLILTEIDESGQIKIDKHDDILVSTSGENVLDTGLGSTSQMNFDKYDDISVSTNDHTLYDPPSRIITPSDLKRARFTYSEDDSGNENSSDDAIARFVINDGILLLTEDGSLADGIEVEQEVRPTRMKRSRRAVKMNRDDNDDCFILTDELTKLEKKQSKK